MLQENCIKAVKVRKKCTFAFLKNSRHVTENQTKKTTNTPLLIRLVYGNIADVRFPSLLWYAD